MVQNTNKAFIGKVGLKKTNWMDDIVSVKEGIEGTRLLGQLSMQLRG